MRHVSLSDRLTDSCIESLALLLDASTDFVEAVWAQIQCRDAYRSFRVGVDRKRKITLPTELLAELQRKILRRLFYTGPISPAAYAGVPGRSFIDAARIHLRDGSEVLRIDIENAFGSITYGQVAKSLAKRLRYELWTMGLDRKKKCEIASALAHFVTLEKELPLGAPTSVAAFNLVFLDIDREIQRLLDQEIGQRSANYTRYVDDLVISARKDTLSIDFAEKIGNAVWRNGFRLNESKTTLNPVEQAIVHSLCYTRRGLRPTSSMINRWVSTIDALEDELGNPASSPEQRHQIVLLLRGLDGFLQLLFENEGISRPKNLSISVTRQRRNEHRAPIVIDEFWP